MSVIRDVSRKGRRRTRLGSAGNCHIRRGSHLIVARIKSGLAASDAKYLLKFLNCGAAFSSFPWTLR